MDLRRVSKEPLQQLAAQTHSGDRGVPLAIFGTPLRSHLSTNRAGLTQSGIAQSSNWKRREWDAH
jgi:hypothetical protein